MCIRIYISNFKKQTNKQKNNNNKNTKKQEKLKNKREYLRENRFKSRRPGEGFCRRPHFRKQEYFFLVQPWWNIHLKIKPWLVYKIMEEFILEVSN